MHSKLERYLSTLEGEPFQWGSNDCWTLVRGWLVENGVYQNSIDEIDARMGDYSSALEAYRLMKEKDLVLSPSFLERWFGERGGVKQARACKMGSVAVAPMPFNRGWRLGLVDMNGRVAGLAEEGLVREYSPYALAVEIE